MSEAFHYLAIFFLTVYGFFYDLFFAFFYQSTRGFRLLLRRQIKSGLIEPSENERLQGRRFGPILLIHGLNMDTHCMQWLKSGLLSKGYGPIYFLQLQPFSWSIPEQAQQLKISLEKICQKEGKPHVIGHSLGGVIARYAIQELDGSAQIASLITLGSPHQGSPVARLAVSLSGRQLIPSSGIFLQINKKESIQRFFPENSPPVPTLFLWAKLDLLVPRSFGSRLPGVNETFFREIPYLGHTSILRSRRTLHAIEEFYKSQGFLDHGSKSA